MTQSLRYKVCSILLPKFQQMNHLYIFWVNPPSSVPCCFVVTTWNICLWYSIKPRPNRQTLFARHFELCSSNMLACLTTTTNIAWQAHFACQFKNIFCLSQAKNVCQAHVCVVAKPTDIVLDKQNCNVCQTMFVRFRSILTKGRQFQAEILSFTCVNVHGQK